jgi:hypothetical protein
MAFLFGALSAAAAAVIGSTFLRINKLSEHAYGH